MYPQYQLDFRSEDQCRRLNRSSSNSCSTRHGSVCSVQVEFLRAGLREASSHCLVFRSQCRSVARDGAASQSESRFGERVHGRLRASGEMLSAVEVPPERQRRWHTGEAEASPVSRPLRATTREPFKTTTEKEKGFS